MLDLSKYEAKEVELGEEEIGDYWKPENIGDTIMGNISEFYEDDYNGKKQTRINLYRNQALELSLDPEVDDPVFTLLPSHAHLKRYYADLEVGDFIKVTVTNIIERKKINREKKEITYNVFEYDVQKYPDLNLEF